MIYLLGLKKYYSRLNGDVTSLGWAHHKKSYVNMFIKGYCDKIFVYYRFGIFFCENLR